MEDFLKSKGSASIYIKELVRAAMEGVAIPPSPVVVEKVEKTTSESKLNALKSFNAHQFIKKDKLSTKKIACLKKYIDNLL